MQETFTICDSCAAALHITELHVHIGIMLQHNVITYMVYWIYKQSLLTHAWRQC